MDREASDEESDSTFRITMADGLRPLTKFNFILGVSTYWFTSSGRLKYPLKRFTKGRVILTAILISVSAILILHRIGVVLISPEYTGMARFNRMVELFCQFVSCLNPLMLIIISLFKSTALAAFFREMGKYNARIHRFAEPVKVCATSRKFFVLHMIMLITSATFVILRMMTSMHPEDVNLRNIVISLPSLASTVSIILGVFTLVLKSSAVAFIECFNLQIATCFYWVIHNLTVYILTEANSWKVKFADKEIAAKLSPSLPVKQKAPLIPTSLFKTESLADATTAASRPIVPELEGTTPGQQICFVIRKIQHVATMQNVANKLFSTILAMDVGFTVLMVVILKYLLIRNVSMFAYTIRETYVTEKINAMKFEDNSIANTSDMIFPSAVESISNGTLLHIDRFDDSMITWIFFLCFDLCYSIRLVLLAMGLGRVYSASVKFNCVLSKVLIKAQRLADLAASSAEPCKTCNGNSYQLHVDAGGNEKKLHYSCNNAERRGELVTAVEASTVLAFISTNTAHPIAFSAGGLVTFNGSTILFIVSIIISYVVFLLQA